jgi:dynein heavy chain
MKLVLDQELQKYNNLIDIMNDTLRSALYVIDGKSLINDKIEAFITSLEIGDIPDVWADSAYPTMEDLDGFLSDLKKRTEFLRDW